ncbi:MAG: hypothetical protein WAN86_09260 [Hyphomicrobiaceae bacterium]
MIEQIQRDCVDKNTSVSDLLRKVKLAASKLGIADVEEWVTNELEGYKSDVPDYRVVFGTPMAWEPDTGEQPILGSLVGMLSRKPQGEAIASIEECLASPNHKLGIRFPDSIAEALDKANHTHTHYYLQLPRSQLARIIDRVRTLVLDWTTRLEKAGVVGTEFSFTENDKQKAQGAAMHISIGTVQNFTGNLGQGNVSGAITSAGLDVEGVRVLAAEMRQYAADLAKAGVNSNTLEAKIGAIEAELRNTKPDQSVLRGLLGDIRNALSGAAGSIIASGVIYRIGGLLGA